MRTRAQTLGNAPSPSPSPPRSHSPASPYINCVRPHYNVSSGSFASSSSSSSSSSTSSSSYLAPSTSKPSSSQKHRQQQQYHADHPNIPRFDTTSSSSSSRVSHGSGTGSGGTTSQSLPRSLVASASGSLNGRCLEPFAAYRLTDS